MKYLIASFLSLIAFVSFAQNDVTTWDKIYFPDKSPAKVLLFDYGDVENGKRVVFTKSDGTIDSLSPEDVLGFTFFQGNIWESKTIILADTSYKVFAERLTRRKITFYAYLSETERYFFFEKPNTEDTYLLSSTDYKQELSKIYGLPLEKLAFINNTGFNLSSLSAAIKRLETKNYAAFYTSQFSLETGVINTKLYWEDPAYGSQTFENSWAHSLGFQAALPIDYSPLAISSGITFNRYNQLTPLLAGDSTQYSFKSTQLKIPLGIRFTLASGKIQPYIGFGGLFEFNLRPSFQRFQRVAPDSVLTTNLIDGTFMSKNPIYFQTVIGVSVALNNERKLYLESRYAYQNSNDALKNNQFQLIFGITL